MDLVFFIAFLYMGRRSFFILNQDKIKEAFPKMWLFTLITAYGSTILFGTSTLLLLAGG